jgi:hypothetical protein
MCGVQFYTIWSINWIGIGKETFKSKYCKLCSILFSSVNVTEFRTTVAYSSLDLTAVKYNIYTQSREEDDKALLRTRLNNLIQ